MPISKKDIETVYFQRFQSLLPSSPQGTVIPTEEPDFLVRGPESVIGVELTELHRDVQAGTVSLQASEAMRQRVVARAQELYGAGGHPPIRCTVFMSSAYIRKDQVEGLAMSIAHIAIRNLPGPNSSTQESYDWTNRSYFPELLGTVAVHRLDPITENFFSCPGATWVASLSSADIERALASKEAKYTTYRKKCDEAWLLINADIGPMSTWYEFDPTAIAGPFMTSFDRVFVLRHFSNKLHELSIAP